jgi:hypothetical protein
VLQPLLTYTTLNQLAFRVNSNRKVAIRQGCGGFEEGKLGEEGLVLTPRGVYVGVGVVVGVVVLLVAGVVVGGT